MVIRFKGIVGLIFAVVLIVAFASCASSPRRHGPYVNETSTSLERSSTAEDQLADVLSRTIVISAALAAEEYALAHIEIDRLREGSSYTFTRRLYAGNDYKIVGIGGQGIEDLDIYVYDASGELVDRDTQTDNLPVVQFHVYSTQTYRIKVKFYSAEDGWDSSDEAFFSVALGFK